MVDLEPYSNEILWILIVGFIVAFILAFGIGANDVANSFGTSVGSKVLTLRQACILATIFEILGSILIGAKVSDTIRKGIIDPKLFEDPKELMLGQLSSLIGCCIWLLVATFFNLPVSGTHSIVGATVGFALVAHGSKGIQWIEFAKIAGSWFASPALAGIISVAVFIVIRKFILEHPDQLTVGLRWLPVFYGITIMINVFSILLSAPPLLYFDRIPLWGKFLTTILVGLLVALLVMIIVKPRLRKSIELLVKKKKDIENIDQHPEAVRTEGRFASYPAHLENTNMNSKCIQVDHIIFAQDLEIARCLRPDLDSSRPYDTIRSRKDLEPTSPGVSTVSRIRRESERSRSDAGTLEAASAAGQRVTTNQPVKTPIVRLPQINNGTAAAATTAAAISNPLSPENRALLLSTDDDAVSYTSSNLNGSDSTSDEVEDVLPGKRDKKKKVDTTSDSIEVAVMFKYLQILTAIFGAFAHGGNDVSNAIGPLIGLWLIFSAGSVSASGSTPLWVLFYGGLGISVGLWIWGRRVIRTIGEDLTKITPSSGFVIEISTAFTVLFASNLSIPVSTTHCKVGSVVAIGRIRSKQSVDWSLFRNIFVAWIVTVPVTGGIAAGVMALLRLIFL